MPGKYAGLEHSDWWKFLSSHAKTYHYKLLCRPKVVAQLVEQRSAARIQSSTILFPINCIKNCIEKTKLR